MTRLAVAPLLTVIVLLGLSLRVYDLGADSLWGDEVSSVLYARLPLGEIWGADTMPPLYYALLHFWRVLGESEIWLRLSSALVSSLSVPLLYLAGVATGGRRLGLLAALLQASSPYALYYAQELRMYALLEFAGALALLGFARLLADPAAAARPLWRAEGRQQAAVLSWALYLLGSLLALYSHNTGFLLPLAASAAAVLAWWRRPQRLALLANWLLVSALLLLLWAPYWPELYRQLVAVQAEFWIQQPTLEQVLRRLTVLHLGLYQAEDLTFWLSLPLGLGLVGLGMLRAWRGVRPWLFAGLALALLPPLLELLAGLLFRPVFLHRTLIWTALPTTLLLAASLEWLWRFRRGSLRRRRAVLLLLAAAALMRAFAVVDLLSAETRPDWRGLAGLTLSEVAAGEPLLISPGWEAPTLRFYQLRLAPPGAELPELTRLWPGNATGTRESLLALATASRWWLVQPDYHHRQGILQPEIAEALPCAEPGAPHWLFGLTLQAFERRVGC